MIKHGTIIFREWKPKIKHSQAKIPLALKIDALYGDKRSDALKKIVTVQPIGFEAIFQARQSNSEA